MSNLQWKSNLDNKLHTIKIVILNTKWKDCKSCQNLCMKNFMYKKKFYIHKIAALNLSKIYFQKNAKKTCKPNNCNLNHNWIMIYQICDVMMSISTWGRVHFWIYLLKHNSLSHQTWPTDRSQLTITCSKLTIKTLEQGMKYVQS